jgi:endonuclease G, mitochondrial
VFAADDRWFHGRDELGAARIQIPARFWKIVVVNGPAGAEAYGFVLSQDVTTITETEFYVTDEWKSALTRISDLQALLRGWVDLAALVAIDRYDAVIGA